MTMFTSFLPYWRNESSGKLALAVERYFAFSSNEDSEPLTDSELILLKGYLKFWIDYPWLGFEARLDNLRAKFAQAETYNQLQDCIDTALELGIDPF